MLAPRRIAQITSGVMILVALSAKATSTGSINLDLPPGFSLVFSATGVQLYGKDHQGGNPHFVQVIDLSQGAYVELLHGPITDPGINQGVYGGDNPEIARQSLQEVWTSYSSANPNAICVTNGQFFSTDDDPTPLAFPIKDDGRILSDGYGISEYQGQKLMLEIWEDRANIVPFTEDALYSSSAPDIIVGLVEDADKWPDQYVGRTFVGISDTNDDGQYETILIFNSKTARQPDVASILREFGAARVMMLDGGGSSQLICKDLSYVSSTRTIPQTLAVARSAMPVFLNTVINQPSFPILNEGEVLHVEAEIANTGLETWDSDVCQLVNRRNRWGADESIPLDNDVNPGETAVLTWTTEPFSKWGIYSTEWYMSRGDVEFSSEPIEFSVIVLPRGIEETRRELEEQLERWIQEQRDNIEELVLEWLQEQIERTITDICTPTAVILPVAVLIVVSRYKKSKENDIDARHS